MASSSSSRNWVYDVFPSFRGKDVRETFLTHLRSAFDCELILNFRDNEIKKSHFITPELEKAITGSRIAILVLSENYCSSSWCLDELVQIVKCKEEFDQLVIPIFYGVDVSHVGEQSGDFGIAFEKTCKIATDDKKQIMWKEALTHVSMIQDRYISSNWSNEANMIKEIAKHVLSKLNPTSTKGFGDSVGIEDHIVKISSLLCLESDEVKMVGIWGFQGIGKTTIARALYCRLSIHFQGRIFIDTAFISKTTENFTRTNLDDHNMKLHLQQRFLSKILNKKDIKIEHLGAAWERLKSHKVLIFIDDLDDIRVLKALVNETQWFGYGSKIIVITYDRNLLSLHGIDQIYEVPLPSKNMALEIFCRSAFGEPSPTTGFKKLASQVASYAYGIPLGLTVLGLDMRERHKKDWLDMLPRLERNLNGKLLRSLMISYDGLDTYKDRALFRCIACLFNSTKVNDIEMLLSDSDFDVGIGLGNLVDKALIQVRCNTVEMQRGVQEMGKEIVRAQSNEPGDREYLVDSKDVCNVLNDNTGTENVLGIALNLDEIDELHVHENAFKGMYNLRFLNVYTLNLTKEVILPESFDYLSLKLKLLCWDNYPMQYLPSKFHPKNLIKLRMHNSKLEILWKGVKPLKCLKDMDLVGSRNLKEIPVLSMATNLERLCLKDCSSLEKLPSGINLKSLRSLDLRGCSRLRIFPDISKNVLYLYLDKTAIEEIPSNLRLENLVVLHMQGIKREKLWQDVQPLTPIMTMLHLSLPTNFKKLYLSDIPNLVELPSSLQNLNKVTDLRITECKNLETLPSNINLESLNNLDFSRCSRLKNFPNISTNISSLDLSQTAVEEVPEWIENLSKLRLISMWKCQNLKFVSLNISKLKHLEKVDFSDCQALIEANWHYCPIAEEATSCLASNCVSKAEFRFINCFNLDQEALIERQKHFKHMIFSGEQVPSYFTHRVMGSSLVVSLLETNLSQQGLRVRACAVVESTSGQAFLTHLKVCCRFKGRLGDHFDSVDQPHSLKLTKATHLIIFDCNFPMKEDNSPLAELNYEQVDVDFRLSRNSMSKIKGCGIQLYDVCSSPESQPCNLNVLPHVWEGDKSKPSSDLGNETERCEETEKSRN